MTREEASRRVFDALAAVGVNIDTVREETLVHGLHIVGSPRYPEFCHRVTGDVLVSELVLNVNQWTTIRDIVNLVWQKLRKPD